MTRDISKPDFSKTPYSGFGPHSNILDYPLNELTEANYSIRLSSIRSYVFFDTRKSFVAAMNVLVPVSGSFEKSPAVENGCFLHFVEIELPKFEDHCG